MLKAKIHPLSDVQSRIIGEDTRIWQFVVILPEARIGRKCDGLYIPPLIWREIDNFSSGVVCLALASEPYDETGYYREYRDFLAAVKDEV